MQLKSYVNISKIIQKSNFNQSSFFKNYSIRKFKNKFQKFKYSYKQNIHKNKKYYIPILLLFFFTFIDVASVLLEVTILSTSFNLIC